MARNGFLNRPHSHIQFQRELIRPKISKSRATADLRISTESQRDTARIKGKLNATAGPWSITQPISWDQRNKKASHATTGIKREIFGGSS